MKNEMKEWIDRYVYAVVRNLPVNLRSDSERELRNVIGDLLKERCGEFTPMEEDLKMVLSDLGTPADLAHKYNPDKETSLIGPPYYSKYKLVIRIAMFCVLIGTLLSGVLYLCIPQDRPWYLLLGQWAFTGITGAALVFAFITGLFAFFQQKKISLPGNGDALETLPPVPDKKEEVKRGEILTGMVFLVVFSILFLTVPQVFGIWVSGEEGMVSVFQTQVIRDTWFLVTAFCALGLISDSIKLFEGQYTKRLAWVTTVLNLLTMIPACFFLLNPEILNPAFHRVLTEVLQEKSPFAVQILQQINRWILLLIIIVLFIDIGSTWLRTMKYPKRIPRKSCDSGC